ncbi:hypothetical protein NE857_06435 [Nocardiopsis exhalans]|uniref:Uncharacterized protein n=1 Tax=Nocardiopsis exhalans TaxID=163604 RepID=A0ABY5DCN7_9ACTN|nr:hypothetical protein [Nocardiopsis exhalans]USY21258.1 hypothetical protein NE857_06435 [Nocardiopsis exhalans]
MNTLLTSATVLADGFSLDKDTVTPGVMGFLAIFAIGVCLYFLMRNMLGKLRGVSARADEQESDEQESAEQEATESTGSTGSTEATEESGQEKASGSEAAAGGSSAEDTSTKA